MSGAPALRRQPHLAIPSECRELIDRGSLMAINHSGGKDSQAMTTLLSHIVPRDQLLVVHAPLGEVEWPGTIEHIESTIPDDVPLLFARTASGKSLLERIEERRRFPAVRCGFAPAIRNAGPSSASCAVT